MTVGELVYKQAIEQGYNPTFAEGLISPLNKVAETYKKVFDDMQEPLKHMTKAANSVTEALRPQMEAISKIKIPTLPTLPSFIPPSFYDEKDEFIMPEFTRPIQEVRIINPEDISIASPKRSNEFVIASYLLQQNATWESLSIRFIDGHFVQISYPNMESKKFDYKDMGFVNMKTTKPDLKWKLLQAIADNDGALTNKNWHWKFGRNIKYELNEGLKRFFGMTDSPIPHYTKKRGYAPLFYIRGEK